MSIVFAGANGLLYDLKRSMLPSRIIYRLQKQRHTRISSCSVSCSAFQPRTLKLQLRLLNVSNNEERCDVALPTTRLFFYIYIYIYFFQSFDADKKVFLKKHAIVYLYQYWFANDPRTCWLKHVKFNNNHVFPPSRSVLTLSFLFFR